MHVSQGSVRRARVVAAALCNNSLLAQALAALD
jgi:hypothetical protein